MSKPARTRFAPSPTGFQHIGGFRTGLWAWLLAKQKGGQFLLRIEDTDQERRVPGAIRYLIDSLKWLGISYDEGPNQDELKSLNEECENAPTQAGPYAPYVQSFRKERYLEVAEELVSKGAAYRCDCTPEELEEQRKYQTENKLPPGYSGRCRTRQVEKDAKHVIRLIIPEDKTFILNDGVRGQVIWENPSLRDTVLLKSDGMPTYHLAVVVDDHDMQITHVLRGEEWLSSYPIHALVYEALGWNMPQFCHLSLILGPDGKKLSKRHGAESLDYFKEQGFLPDAIVNYMVRVGWSLADGDEQEIFTRQELIEKFALDRLSRSGGIFDMEKLLWMNGQYLRKLSSAEFTKLAKPFIEKAELEFIPSRWDALVNDIQSRCRTLADSVEVAGFLFKKSITFDKALMFKKGVDQESAKKIIAMTVSKLKNLDSFEKTGIEDSLRSVADTLSLKPGPTFQVIRLAISGSLVSPPLFESMVALGKEESLRRIEAAEQYV